MEYTITAITREQIPDNICLYHKHSVKNGNIFLFQFINGLMIAYESDIIITAIEEIMDDLIYYYNMWLDIRDNCDSSNEFQGYYLDLYEKYIITSQCEKIWNYHINNQHIIASVIYYYEGDTTSYDEFTEDEGFDENEVFNED